MFADTMSSCCNARSNWLFLIRARIVPSPATPALVLFQLFCQKRELLIKSQIHKDSYSSQGGISDSDNRHLFDRPAFGRSVKFTSAVIPRQFKKDGLIGGIYRCPFFLKFFLVVTDVLSLFVVGTARTRLTCKLGNMKSSHFLITSIKITSGTNHDMVPSRRI